MQKRNVKKNNLKLYKDQKVSIYEIQKAIGVSRDTLYKYARGKRKIENINIKMFLDICYFLKEEPNELYKKMKEYQEENK